MSDEVDTHRTTFRHSLTLTAFGVAFCKMQSELGVAIKDSINPHHKYHYNDVASIIQASRPALTNNGFAVMQFPVTKERTVEIETFVLHKSGEWVAETLAIPIAKGDAQGIGSAITYGCKYALLAILGLSRGDDDGQAAVNSVNEQATRNEKDQRAKYVAVLQAGSEKGMLGLLGAWDSLPASVRSEMEAACEQMMTYAIGQDHELLKMAAKVGTTNLRDTWKAMHKDTRTALTPELAALKAMAQAADEANQVVV